MTKPAKTLMLLAAAIAGGTAGLFWNGDITPSTSSSLVTEAHARIGRPLTPMSYAGVARRTVRRGAYYGAAAGVGAAAAPVPYYGRPPCGYYPYPPCY